MLKRIFAWLFGKNKKDLPVVPVVHVNVSPDKLDATQQARATLDRAQRMHNEGMERVLLRRPQPGLTITRLESRRVKKSSTEDDGLMAVSMMGYGAIYEDDACHRSGTGKSHVSQSDTYSGHSSHSRIASDNDSGFDGGDSWGSDCGGGD